MNKAPKVVAIVVTYHPDLDSLKLLMDATAPQVSELVLVDNTPAPGADLERHFAHFKQLSFIPLLENWGIAYAHNRGFEWAEAQGADYVLLLDQDSVPTPEMVANLLAQLTSEGAGEQGIVAAGPSFEDRRNGSRSYFMVSHFGFPHRYKPLKKSSPQNLITVGFLISSGTLISMAALRQIGGKRSKYFIDHVDTEWCLRAKALGKKLIGVHDALLLHSLGDEVKQVWFGYTRNVAYHTPLRDYYMFRNTLLMLKETPIRRPWRLFLLLRLVQFAVYFLIFAKDRAQRLRMMSLGIWHGLTGRDGKLNPSTGECTPAPRTKFDPA